MKIFLMTTHMEMGGIPIYVVELARTLKRRGHQPVVVSDAGVLERRLAREGIPHIRIPCRTSSEINPSLWFRAFPQILRAIRRERPELIHSHTRVTQVLGWAASTLTATPYVTTCHGLYKFRLGRRFFRCWGKWVMAISNATMNRVVQQYRLAPPHQVILIENGIDVERFCQAPDPAEVERFRRVNGLNGGPVIGVVARLSPVKGLDLLLKAAPALFKEFPDLQLLLVGDGPAREDLVRLAHELRIADRVAICPSVEDTRVPMALMQVFAAPAWEEGFGLAIVEAMAAGVPVVASDAGGPGEIIEQDKSGLLIQPGDTARLEQSLRKLLKDPAARERIARQGQARVKQRFDLERVVTQVEEVYGWAVRDVKRDIKK